MGDDALKGQLPCGIKAGEDQLLAMNGDSTKNQTPIPLTPHGSRP